jgi:hypothetical protein
MTSRRPGAVGARQQPKENFMKLVIIVAGILALTPGLALAQQSSEPRPTIGMGSKTMESCTTDTRKFCGKASDYMRKECLVKNWDHITSDCQDALGQPFDGLRRGG